MNELKIFAPATVANVACGFDAMAFALDSIGDEMVFRKTALKGIHISKIEGANLPFDININVVGVVAQAMLKNKSIDFGIDIEIYKNFMPGSGLGSSAASAAGTAFAINELLNKPFTQLELTKFATLGEAAACGTPIADNVSAVIYGGFTLVRSYTPLDIISIPTPKELVATVIHPQIEIKTADSRNALKSTVSLKDATTQWSNVGGLISGLYTNDFNLISRSLIDVVAEPARKHLIPHFDEVKNAALNNGALGCSISGSGPSIFVLSKGMDTGNQVANAMKNIYSKTGIDFNVYVSKINTKGVKII